MSTVNIGSYQYNDMFNIGSEYMFKNYDFNPNLSTELNLDINNDIIDLKEYDNSLII